MPRLVVSTSDLFSQRIGQIRTLVRSIAASPQNLQIRPQKHPLGQVISVSDSFSADALPTERLFRTTSERLYGQYYEIWSSDEKGRNFHLYQNYFHLYALPSKTERDQLFCLHTEPEAPLQPMIQRVKSTPHIHVNVKEERLAPVSKAHLPVCYSTTEAVLGSLQAFDRTFAEAIKVIRHEVVDRFT